MKITLGTIGAVVAAILVAVSAGCVSPSTDRNSSTVIPDGTTASPAFPAVTLPLTPAGGGTEDPQVARTGDTVSVYYTGTFENGTLFDSNRGNPLPTVFILGNSSVIEGFEEAVTGMSVNQEKTVDIPAAKAYGVYNASLIRTVNRTGPIASTTFTAGESYSIRDRTSNAVSIVKILEVTPTTVTWDANDPLAGLNFTFTIKLTGIKRP
jgi:peptidylprolyl isomerase